MKEVIKKGVCNRYPPQVSVSFMPVPMKVKGAPPQIKETTKGISPPVRGDRPGCGEWEELERVTATEVLERQKDKFPVGRVCGMCRHYIPMVNPQENWKGGCDANTGRE